MLRTRFEGITRIGPVDLGAERTPVAVRVQGMIAEPVADLIGRELVLRLAGVGIARPSRDNRCQLRLKLGFVDLGLWKHQREPIPPGENLERALNLQSLPAGVVERTAPNVLAGTQPEILAFPCGARRIGIER